MKAITVLRAVAACGIVSFTVGFASRASADETVVTGEAAEAADSGERAIEKFGDRTSICSGKVVSINSLDRVLYKPENIHGGRGPSFLVQNPAERTGKKVIEIRNARCEVIGSFGLFATDQPYGARYYSRSGGSGFSDRELYDIAGKIGSSNILIEGVNGKWIRVNNPLNRDGNIAK